MILCLDCQTGLDPDHVFVHLKREHELVKTEKARVDKLVARLMPLPVLEVSLPPPHQSPVENLNIIDAFFCLVCFYTAKNKGSMRTHIKATDCFTEIQKKDQGYAKVKACKAQAFFLSLGRKLFPVSYTPNDRVAIQLPGLTQEMIENEQLSFSSFVSLVEEKRVVGEISSDEVGPWLGRTGWINHFRLVNP